MIINIFENIICPRCFSNDVYKFGRDNYRFQKYQCKHYKRQFILEKSSKISKGYPRCPICHKST
ncbi:IS1 family transposase [Clostridium sp. WILCCON 0269]|uniref:IS1 family transposase n=1 Tax=Candidatus Clostridium eludens TaxID=3381663 RepID=A0ABW8SRG5_9CLOT